MRTHLDPRVNALVRPWLLCALPPVPLLWVFRPDQTPALALFLVGCVCFTAVAVHRALDAAPAARRWGDVLACVAGGLMAALAVFLAASIATHGLRDPAALFIAAQMVVPALCVTPYVMLRTRQFVPTVVFTLFLLGAMKMLAGVETNLVYGWGDGHHELPWFSPNLMLMGFWANSVILCATLCMLAARTWRRAAP